LRREIKKPGTVDVYPRIPGFWSLFHPLCGGAVIGDRVALNFVKFKHDFRE
jgi:hypothetical protein